MANRMDSMISHGMGKVKAIKARIEGLVGVFQTLAEQHGEVAALLERARSSPEKRAELWPTIRMELLSHERGELRELYPVLRMYPETRALADGHDEEARELEQLISVLDATLIASDAWDALLDRLTETVLAHAKEEENQIFPQAQRVIGEERALEIEPKFLLAKQQVAAAV
jgi:iron-sulfur cluster repair protein YtfE (RIC family)